MFRSLIRAATAAAIAGGGVGVTAAAGAFSGAASTGAAAATGAAIASPAVLTAATSTTAACNADAHWPAYVQGRPDGFDPRDDGVYLWHNPTGGWGLRVSHPLLPGKADRVVFSGTITSAGQIGHVVRVKDEKDDVVRVGPQDHTLYFRFVNFGGVDGVDFTTTCTPGLRVDLKTDASSMQTKFVHLGDKKVNPGSDPFRIRRVDTDTTTSPA